MAGVTLLPEAGVLISFLTSFTISFWMSLDVVPTFDARAYRRQNGDDNTVQEHGSHNHADGHDQERSTIEKSVATSEIIIHTAMTPPLLVIKQYNESNF